jgi:gliding motility-associated-like protein
MSLSRLKQIAILLLVFCPIVVLAQAPTPTDMHMTGVMKMNHGVTINFTYFDPQGTAQTGVEYQWFEYDNEADVTGTPIGAAIAATFTPTSALLLGKMLSCRVRVSNALDGYGPWTEFKPWDAATPNPVLDNNTSCFTAGTTSANVNFSLSSNTSTFLCSPRTVEYTITYTGINYSTAAANPPKIIIDWGDGIVENLNPTEVDIRETNQAKERWTITRQHIYDYDIPGRLASSTPGERCTYTIRFAHGYGNNICPGGTTQSAKVTVWDQEDNALLGSFDVAHDPTSAGMEAVPPAPLPASTENVNVCENDISAVRLLDNTDFNCTPPLEANVPNAQGRWMQWVYGATGSTIDAPGGATGSIIINGVSYSAAQLPVYSRPVWVRDPFMGPSAVMTDDIRMPATATSGQQFFITLRSWNECNRFDRFIADNCGLNPQQGVGFDNFSVYAGATTIQASSQYNAALQACQPALTSPFFAFSAPVERQYTITITDKPDKPVAADKVVCNAENTTSDRTIAVSPTVGGLTYRWYATRADALSNSGLLFTGPSYAIPAGLVNTAMVHDFFVTAFAASGCVSDPDTVYFTRRASVGTINITGPADVCPGGTYSYRASPFNHATPLTPGGNTEYFWTVPAGWIINSGQGTREISVSPDGDLGAANVTLVKRYTTTVTSGAVCESSVSYPITVRANPSASPVTPVNLCQGTAGVELNGNPTNPFGTITSHVWTGNTGILNQTNIQNPTVLTTAAAATYALTYTVTNSIGCPGSATVTVNISANPTLASAGPDQPLCQVSLTSNPLAGSDPSPGTGTWTLVGKPIGSTATDAGFSNQNNRNATFTGDLNGQYTLRWTVVNDACTSSDEVVIDFGTDPGAQNAGTDNGFCGTTGSLGASAQANFTGTWTQVGGPMANNTTFTNANSPTSGISLINTSAAAFGTYTYRWTVASGTCTPRTDDVQITFSRPATASVPADFTTCIDPLLITSISLSGTVGDGGGAAQQGRWERVSAGTGVFGNAANPGAVSTGPTINDQYTPSAAEVAAGTIQLRVVATDHDGPSVTTGPCANVNSATLTITVDRKPTTADAGSATPVCLGEDATLTATPVTNGTGEWSGADGTIANAGNATTTVTGLTANATFTWTVKSALGALGSPPVGSCATTTDDVLVTVRPLPDALDPEPDDLCETTEGTFTAISVTLSAYNDGVTGLIGSPQRTVRWYGSVFDQQNDINVITTADISNGEVLFTRVTDTSTAQNCDQLGEVTFTVNPKPLASPQDLAFCEEFPIGSTVVNDIDLTDPDLKDDITGGAADRTIFWYNAEADAEADVNRIASPGDVDIIGNATVFARVVNDLTGCFNVARVNLIVKPLPADLPVLGSATPCVNDTELYRVGQLSGATYNWTIPAQFTPLGGGGVNDFYVLLAFPSVATADISVQIVLNGCAGNVLTKSIAVSNTPPGFSIIPPAETICENGTFAYSVSNIGSSSFNWQIFRQSDGLAGGGVVASGQTTGNASITFQSQDVTLRVTESNASGCVGPPEELLVTVHKRPVMDELAQAVCGGDAIGIQLSENATSPVTAATFDVQVPVILPGITPISGPTTGIVGPTGIENDAYRNQTIAPVLQLFYRVTPISAAGCAGDEKNVILNIKAEPLLDATPPSPVCSGLQTGVTLRSALGFFPADKFIIDSIRFDATVLTPLTALPSTGVLLNNDAIFSNRWQNVTSSNQSVIYYVRPYSSATGCYGNPPVPVQVIIQPEPLVNPIASMPPICSGDVLSIALTSANTATPQFVWTVSQVGSNISGATGSTTNIITDQLFNTGLTLDSVVYKITASDLSSSPVCSGPSEFITVKVRPAPTAQNITDIVCSDVRGGNTYTEDLLSLQPTVSADAGVGYTWFTDLADFSGSQIPPAQLSGYALTDNTPIYVRVENGSSSCGRDASITYTVHPTPELTATALTTTDPLYNISCNGKADGQINVTAQYGTGHTFSKDGNSYTPAVAFSGLGQGTYIIRTRNAEGCKDSLSIPIVEPAAISFVAGAVNASCFNDPTPDGQITVTGSGGAGTLGYFLLQDPGNTTGATSGTFTGLRAGSYIVRIEDNNNCSKVTTAIPVGQPAELKLTIDITSDNIHNGYDVSCAGASDGEISVLTTVGGTPGATGYTYVLDQDPLNVTGQTSGVFQGLSANILYTITVTDGNGCPKTSLPEFLIDPIPLFAGVVGFDKNVCTGGDPTAFQELAAPFGGIGTYTYQWDESVDNITFTPVNGATNPVFDAPALTDTTYYRRRVFSGTCAAEVSDTVKVIINPLPVATLAPSNSPVCEGGFFTLDFEFQNGTAPYYFDYNEGGSTISRIGAAQTPVPVINYTAEKTYTLTRVRDFYGCEPAALPAPVTVQLIKLNPNFTIVGPAAQCSGSTFTFEWTVDADVEYIWIWGDSDNDTIFANTLPVGMHQISHEFFSADVRGNSVTPVSLSARSTVSSCGPLHGEKKVTVFPAIIANAFNAKQEICSGDEVEFTNLSSGDGTHRWFYRRFGVNEVLEERIVSSPSSQKYTFTNTTASNPLVYEIVYQITSANCSAEVIMRDTVYRGMVAAFDTLSVGKYIGGNALVSFVNNSQPTNDPDFQYSWEFGPGSNPTLHTGSAPPNPVRYTSIGEKDVRLTVSNVVAANHGLTCSDVETKTIDILLPGIFADFRYSPQAACFPADISITRNMATGDTYTWTLEGNGVKLISNDSLPTFRITNTGLYVIKLETRNSITGQTAEADNEDTPIQIVDIPFASFETRPGTVFVPDDGGVEMSNESKRANEFFWDFDNDGDTSTEFDPTYFYTLEGKYTITLIASYNYGARDTDGDGDVDPGEVLICRDTAQNVVIAKEGGLIKIPNAFTPGPSPSGGTPNLNGRNDVFLPVMKGIEEFEMQIFDRWGTLIFESQDRNLGWDGFDKNGRMLPSGVYVYKLTMRLSNDQRTTQVGDVTLIR